MTKAYKIILNNRKDSRHSYFINGNDSIGIFTTNDDISCQCKTFFNVLRNSSSFIGKKKKFFPLEMTVILYQCLSKFNDHMVFLFDLSIWYDNNKCSNIKPNWYFLLRGVGVFFSHFFLVQLVVKSFRILKYISSFPFILSSLGFIISIHNSNSDHFISS